jgi:hypothetical protein
MDLILWEVTWQVVAGWLVPTCSFCRWTGEGVNTKWTFPSTKDLLAASQHECGGHDDALRHVVYVRSNGARGKEFIATE